MCPWSTKRQLYISLLLNKVLIIARYEPGVMHLSTQTIKLYSNLLSFSEPLKQAHRILTCGTAENKERLVKRKYISIFMHKFKMLGTNGCFVSCYAVSHTFSLGPQVYIELQRMQCLLQYFLHA